MKNIKINEELKSKIILGGLSLALVTSGFELGKLVSRNNSSSESSNTTITSKDELSSKYLDDYISKRDALEK